ncbi:hypothetical protein TPY_2824 [Sulfobacillus acidophilus TPY]|uniref:Uncharacterized protein n=1 Tax=Sulfobacillus acidophilus (strain ATCC 700253 / DSM 10332 / NAL) TaxID=679936 RepID=G8TTW8_SULAD|nr:hypothetical protein TPY_2824 [Sulfobacillus acidophilus TPY]AEW04559.1 hypothetical protein Sulac_1059 [Sulfobacillus acidophilus DSM 10332]
MQHIHDNKPPLSLGSSSLWVDLVFWHPNQKDARQLTRYLEEYGLGERSQTVEWLDKFTVRLAMWKGKYWYFLTAEEWQQASQDLIAFIKKTATHYQCSKVEYDTRAFAVGLTKKVPRQRHRVEDLVEAPPAHDHPVWWTLTV